MPPTNLFGNPPTIPNQLVNPNYAHPEITHRQELFAKALAGDKEARATLRNTYRLTVCIINRHNLLNGHHGATDRHINPHPPKRK